MDSRFLAPPPLPAGFWFACEYPERPTDPYVRWHYSECLMCAIRADVLARVYPDDSHVAWLVATING